MVGQTTGGGGRSESATWSIAGSVAVPICAVSQGGAYELNGGLVGNYPIPAEGTRVSIERADATQLRVVFTGTLQTAESPVGPWVDIVAAVSPFAVSPSEGARYYRSRQ